MRGKSLRKFQSSQSSNTPALPLSPQYWKRLPRERRRRFNQRLVLLRLATTLETSHSLDQRDYHSERSREGEERVQLSGKWRRLQENADFWLFRSAHEQTFTVPFFFFYASKVFTLNYSRVFNFLLFLEIYLKFIASTNLWFVRFTSHYSSVSHRLFVWTMNSRFISFFFLFSVD